MHAGCHLTSHYESVPFTTCVFIPLNLPASLCSNSPPTHSKDPFTPSYQTLYFSFHSTFFLLPFPHFLLCNFHTFVPFNSFKPSFHYLKLLTSSVFLSYLLNVSVCNESKEYRCFKNKVLSKILGPKRDEIM